MIHFIHQVTLARRQRRGLDGFRVKLPLPTIHGGGFTLSLILLNVKQGSWNAIFLVFGVIRPGIEPVFTVSVADTQKTKERAPPMGGSTHWLPFFHPLSGRLHYETRLRGADIKAQGHKGPVRHNSTTCANIFVLLKIMPQVGYQDAKLFLATNVNIMSMIFYISLVFQFVISKCCGQLSKRKN